jgi:hypothetical protein
LGFALDEIPLFNYLLDFAEGDGGCPEIICLGVFIVGGTSVPGIISPYSPQAATIIIRGPGHLTSTDSSCHFYRTVHCARIFSFRYIHHSDLAKRTSTHHSRHQVNKQSEQKAMNTENIENTSVGERM